MQPSEEHPENATYFVVDLGGGDSRFVLCQRIVMAHYDNGLGVIPYEEVEELFRGDVLRAVALRTDYRPPEPPTIAAGDHPEN